MASNRRNFIKNLSGTAFGLAALPVLNPAGILPNDSANLPGIFVDDESYWAEIRRSYSVSPNVIYLNSGGVSPQSVYVQNAQDRFNRFSNEGPSYYMWRVLDKGRLNVKKALAGLAGCSHEEVAIVRNATEALETLIFGFDLKKGDEILTSTQDYPSMLNAIKQRVNREGVVLKQVSVPVPLDDERELVKRFENAITPKTKIILVSHVINLTGQILPIKEIVAMGKQRGIDVIVDGAHSFGHFDFTMDELGCDFFGTSLHKWLNAPFGTGLLYIRKNRIKDIWPLFGAVEGEEDKIEKLEHLGTRSFPSELTIGHAVDFHNGIGIKRKAERLKYLTDYWVSKVKDNPKISFNTSFKNGKYGAIANVKIDGLTAKEIQKKLFSDYKIYTIAIDHDEVKGVRVSPNIFTSLKELDLLAEALNTITG
jgi:selenocysteine lyase/cysteine desulfurase